MLHILFQQHQRITNYLPIQRLVSNFKMTIVDIEDIHRKAVANSESTYIDPDTGFMVFTEVAHLKRGKCCGNKCRHCPYGWENVRSIKSNGESSSSMVKKLDSGDRQAAQVLLEKVTEAAKNSCQEFEDSKKEDDDSVTSSSLRFSDESREKKSVPYTRKGDRGVSQLFTGERRKKSDPIFEALGTVDELCSFVGVVHAEISLSGSRCDYGPLEEQLLDVMSRLFDLGSCIATPQFGDQKKGTAKLRAITFDSQHVKDLELWIDQLTEEMPELRNFILPTGGRASAHLHVARTVGRRAERRVTELMDIDDVPTRYGSMNVERIVEYLNRLSDYFFTAARWTSYCEGRDEIVYKRPNISVGQRSRVSTNLRNTDNK
mmetsp:Transcript_5851/g.7821  ORF Transcript_5851/g.7821 Transcript_5851/m.7821 type:complete len:375 (+) Transcript_5851:244-1368(+)